MLCLFTMVFVVSVLPSFSQTVYIAFDSASPQQIYAAGRLKQSLLKQGHTIENTGSGYKISFAIDKSLGAEAYSISKQEKSFAISGGDERGLIYGSLSMAEDLRNGTLLKNIQARNEKPHVPLRAIKFDLPWDTYRHSYALDLHDETCRDTNYWKSFLDMMAENRLNSLSLWNLHPYPYLIKSKNFPEATPFTDAEMKEWQSLFHTIFKLAKERAVDTYIIPFNIFVTSEFSRAHNVAMDNLEHHFFVRGDTAEIIKRYTRESVTQMLEEYPDLTGIGLTLGEGMAGMTPQEMDEGNYY